MNGASRTGSTTPRTARSEGERGGLPERLGYILLELDAIAMIAGEILSGPPSSAGPRAARSLHVLDRLQTDWVLPLLMDSAANGSDNARLTDAPMAWFERQAEQEPSDEVDPSGFQALLTQFKHSRNTLLTSLSTLGGTSLDAPVRIGSEGKAKGEMPLRDVLAEVASVDHLVLRDLARALHDVKRDAEQAKRTMAGTPPTSETP